MRLRESTPAIVQIVAAATGAYAIARYGLGHAAPLLAATVTVSSLGLVRDARPRRVLDTVIGMVLGILVAELVVVLAGSGWWQLAVTLAMSLAVARFLSRQPGFAIAAAIQSIIVVVVPAEAPFLRLADGVVGALVALAATALIPRNPARTLDRDATALFAAFDNALGTVVQALRYGSRERAARGLEKARGLHPLVEDWRVALDSARAVARISPFLRGRRAELDRQERIRHSMDLAVRNLRVIARRTVYVVDDERARPVIAALMVDLAHGAALVSASLTDPDAEAKARDTVQAVARRLDPVAILPDGTVSEQSLGGALRPLATDLLTAAGMPAVEARAALPRI